MKHATATALDQIEPLLARLRLLPLKEKSRGVFYLKSKAFLHFHEDPAGLFADIRDVSGQDFDRFQVDKGGGAEAVVEAARSRSAS